MAITITRYNHTEKLIRNGEVNFANLKFMLRSVATVTAANTVVSELAGTQVSGNGWAVDGEALASAAVTIVATDGAMIDALDIAVTATGGDIGPSLAGVITDDTLADPIVLWHFDFGGSQTAGNGTEMQINLNASGISRAT